MDEKLLKAACYFDFPLSFSISKILFRDISSQAHTTLTFVEKKKTKRKDNPANYHPKNKKAEKKNYLSWYSLEPPTAWSSP
jgi:hypothetical protein